MRNSAAVQSRSTRSSSSDSSRSAGHGADVERAGDRRAAHDHFTGLDVGRRHPDAHADDPFEVAQGHLLADHPVERREDRQQFTGGPYGRVAVDDRDVDPLTQRHVGLMRLRRQHEHVVDPECQ